MSIQIDKKWYFHNARIFFEVKGGGASEMNCLKKCEFLALYKEKNFDGFISFVPPQCSGRFSADISPNKA